MPGVIYLVGNDQHCKLGYTQDLPKRLKQLQRWPGEIRIFHQIPGNPQMEQQLHQKARTSGLYCGGRSGEWYPIARRYELIRMMNMENPQLGDLAISLIGGWLKTLLRVE